MKTKNKVFILPKLDLKLVDFLVWYLCHTLIGTKNNSWERREKKIW